MVIAGAAPAATFYSTFYDPIVQNQLKRRHDFYYSLWQEALVSAKASKSSPTGSYVLQYFLGLRDRVLPTETSASSLMILLFGSECVNDQLKLAGAMQQQLTEDDFLECVFKVLSSDLCQHLSSPSSSSSADSNLADEAKSEELEGGPASEDVPKQGAGASQVISAEQLVERLESFYRLMSCGSIDGNESL